MKKHGILLILAWIVFQIYSCAPERKDLPVSTPEAEGVSSEAILQFIHAAENSQNELHSFVLLRHGKVIAEGWWSPYRWDLRHTLYSASKSLLPRRLICRAGKKNQPVRQGNFFFS
jgi:hypothetical protein